jgi:putative hemolysin
MATALLVIIVLLIINGLFAMTEIAIVSAPKARLTKLAFPDDKEVPPHHGARVALELAKDPEGFLSSVQVGITLVSVLNGALGGESLAGHVKPLLEPLTWLPMEAEKLSFLLTVVFITYLSLIIGELVPKSLALRSPVAIACAMASPMRWLANLAKPIVWLLGVSTRALLLVFGKSAPASGPTPDEVQVLVREGLVTGGVQHAESEMVEGVFDLRDAVAEEVMRPKPKMVTLQVGEKPEQFWSRVAAVQQTVFPVYDASRDDVLGMVSLRDLYVQSAGGKPGGLKDILHKPVFVAENEPLLSLLKTLKRTELGTGLVTDEFGTIRGMVTLSDLAEEVVGELRMQTTEAKETIRESAENEWMADGLIEIDEVTDLLPELRAAVKREEEPFQTLAGYLVHALDRLPVEGDKFEAAGLQFEVVDMDRQRVDKVRIKRLPPPEPEPEGL